MHSVVCAHWACFKRHLFAKHAVSNAQCISYEKRINDKCWKETKKQCDRIEIYKYSITTIVIPPFIWSPFTQTTFKDIPLDSLMALHMEIEIVQSSRNCHTICMYVRWCSLYCIVIYMDLFYGYVWRQRFWKKYDLKNGIFKWWLRKKQESKIGVCFVNSISKVYS